jgi:methylmalonyl-CoA/ethylmalonyl-CoA epimerase
MTASDIKKVLQIAVVTADLDRAIQVWTEKYGVEPWRVTTYDREAVSDWTRDGRPVDYELRIAIANIGDFMIELVEPVSGESPWSRSLSEHGGADHLHHVLCAYETNDFATGIDDFRRKGVPVEASGDMPGRGISWAFLDSEPDLGFRLEFVTRPGGWLGE